MSIIRSARRSSEPPRVNRASISDVARSDCIVCLRAGRRQDGPLAGRLCAARLRTAEPRVASMCAAICLMLIVGVVCPKSRSIAAEPQSAPVKASESSAKPSDGTPQADANAEDSPAAASKRAAEDLELFELFADTLDQVERNYVKGISRRQLVEAAIRGMLNELDPYSNFIPPKQLERFKVEVENEFGGVGLQVTIENGQLRVISPLVGTPAYRAGVLAGDTIVEIDGHAAKGITLDEAVQRMKGPIGTKVTIKVMRPGLTEPETIDLQRANVHVETVLGQARGADDAWRWLVDEKRKIAYVRITGFGRHTAEDLRKVLKRLTKDQIRGLVLDLRFNPGGLLSAAIEVSDMFVSEGRIVSTEGRNVESRTWDATKKGTFEGFAMAVLVNRYSASASEIVAACLQDHNRAIIVGERTWGKGSVQNVVEMEGGSSALKLTTAGYHRPNGKNIHRYPDAKDSDDWGVVPDAGFEVKLDSTEMTQLVAQQRQRDIVHKPTDDAAPGPSANDDFVDPQLEKALDYLRGKLDAAQPPQDSPPATPAAEASATPAAEASATATP